MPDLQRAHQPTRVVSVIASLNAGGIGPVCRYAAEGMARLPGWQVTLLSLHDPVGAFVDVASGLKVVCLGLDGNCARLFLQWIEANPQDLVITSDVCRIEPAFPFLPPGTRHIVQIHDSGRRYRDVATRHAAWVDGVTCVGRHIEAPLRRSLDAVGFKGLLRTVHNGADFPPPPVRLPHTGPLRLLFMGRMDPMKGISDLVPILERLRKMNVPVTLTIAGGRDELLARQFQRKGLASFVNWVGRMSHDECYRLAAAHDVFLLTSRKEPFGMVTIEAMGMGCVPIAYDIPSGSTEIIEQEKNGLLVPLGNYRAWAAAVERLHLDREYLVALSGAAIDRARSRFNAGEMSGNLAKLVQDVMLNAETRLAQRQQGQPPETPAVHVEYKRGYYRLSAKFRLWMRIKIFSYPRLSYWLINR